MVSVCNPTIGACDAFLGLLEGSIRRGSLPCQAVFTEVVRRPLHRTLDDTGNLLSSAGEGVGGGGEGWVLPPPGRLDAKAFADGGPAEALVEAYERE